MKVLIFGATGMVGQGVLRAALLANDVELVQVVGRSATGVQHPKLREVVHADPGSSPGQALYDYRAIEDRLRGFDACFFCLGASTVGLDEVQYTRINHDLPLAAANTLARLNPDMTFIYVSGQGTGTRDAMWARVKGRTENALLALPFKAAYMFRPGVIQPVHGARSKTPMYRAFYFAATPLMGLARRLWPQRVLTTEAIGVAMLNAVRRGASRPVLESPDLHVLSQGTRHA